MAQPPQPVQIQIEIDEATSQGTYTNLALISHTETEFVFDFIYIQPQQPKAKVRARIISSPVHTKRFLSALQENIQRYEEKFGKIKGNPQSEAAEPRYQGPYL
jgi:hypothetical protein